MRVVGMDMKLVNSFQGLKYEIPLVIIRHFLCYYFDLPFCFSRGGSFTDDHPDSSRPPTASSSRSDLVYSGRQQKSWKFDGYSSDNDVMPCVHFKAVFTLFRTAFLADTNGNPVQCG